MLINEKQIKDIHFDTLPIIICGTGPAGIALALRLEKKDIPVILIEAGSNYFNEKAQSLYEGKVNGNFPNKIKYSRLCQFGGTSGHWGGTCRPLDKYDFKNWPINKSIIDNYLDSACEFLNLKKKFDEKKINDNIKIIEFQQSNLRISKKYFDHVVKSKNIFLILNNSIYDIKILNKKVNSVLIKNYKNQITEIKCKILTLACGGIENSRLLLWFKEKQNGKYFKNKNIGKYWMEHPFKVIGRGFGDFKKINKYFQNNFYKFENYRNWGEKTYSISPTENCIKKNNILNISVQLTLHQRSNDSFKNIAKNTFCLNPTLSNYFLKKFDKKVLCGFTLSSSWEQEPEENNRIILSKEKKNFLSIPQPIIEYSLSKKTINTATVFANELGRLFVKRDLGRIGIDNSLIEGNFLSDAGYHHIGGTRMSDDQSFGVVDRNLKIHDLENMFVAGSSTFPSGGHANPTLTIIQLSQRLADHIIKII